MTEPVRYSSPIEIDWRWLWNADEFAKMADKSAV
jgi:hypothetical protein